MLIEQTWPDNAAAAALSAEVGKAFCMDERGFRDFYSATAPRLRGYLIRSSGNLALADDLLQESYYRLLRADFQAENEEHRKNYLFRIATNLLRDHFRRSRHRTVEFSENLPAEDRPGDRVSLGHDLDRMLVRLNPRDRQLLWLAYVEGASHKEISEITGLKAASVRPMLFRARQRMAGMLREGGLGPGSEKLS